MGPESDAARRSRFEAEALPHLDALYRTARRMTRNGQDAEDLVQDAALRAWRGFDQYRAGTNCKAWLMRILVNAGINAWEKRSRRPQEVDFEDAEATLASPVDMTPVVPSAGEVARLAGLLDDEVKAALEAVPEPFRLVFLLAVVEGFSYKEIAAMLDLPIGTVMSRLFRARKSLQSALAEYGRSHGLASAPERPR